MSDIVTHLRAAAAEPDPARRKAVLRAAAQQLPRGLHPAILNAVVPIPPASRDLEIARAIYLRWAWETPDYATRWAEASPAEPFRDESMALGWRRWRQVDPSRAEAWLAGLPKSARSRVLR